MIITSLQGTESLAKNVAHQLKAKYISPKLETFADGESKISLPKNPKGQTVVLVASFYPNQNEKIIQSLLIAGIAKDYKAKKIILVTPFIPYIRQDTHFENYDSFSAKYIFPLFKNFDQVIAIDPHLQRLTSLKELGKNMTRISTNPLIAEYIQKKFKEDFTIIGPDEESKQWIQKIADYLKEKVVILKKKRFPETKVKIQVHDFKRNVVIIDDIIGTGNTILQTIKMAKSHGAKDVHVIGLHGLLLKKAAKKIKKQASLATTNTISSKYSKIDISTIISDALKKYK